MRRRAAAALAGALALTSCGVGEQDAPVPVPRGDALPAAPPSAGAASPRAKVLVYLVSAGRLVPRPLPAAGATATAALTALLEASSLPSGTRSAIPAGTRLQRAARHGDVLVVDLTRHFTDARAPDQILAIGQVVFTTTAFGVDAVEIRVAGEQVAMPTGDGELVRRPLDRRDYVALVGS